LPISQMIKVEKKEVKKIERQNNGIETILVIEDNHDILKLIRRILQDNNYSVFTAYNYDEAYSIFNIYKNQIDMVITDIILPGKSGNKIVEEFIEYEPELKYLYISGYTDDVIGKDGILDNEINFLQKPFKEQMLLEKIREILEN